MEIKLNHRIETFQVKGRAVEEYGPSADGMRRGGSYAIDTLTTFRFENERHVDDGYTYELELFETSSINCGPQNRGKSLSEEEIMNRFDELYRILRSKGLQVLNLPTYMNVTVKLSHLYGVELDRVTMEFDGFVCPVEPGDDKAMDATSLLDLLHEQGEAGRKTAIMRAVGAKMSGWFKVEANSIPDSLFGGREEFDLPRHSVEDLINTGFCTVEDLKSTLLCLAELGRGLPSLDPWLEQFICALPEDDARQVIKICPQTKQNLDLFRQFCPERIDWQEVEFADFQESDLDLMIQFGQSIRGEGQWRFIEHCLGLPCLRVKLIENAYMLGYYDLHRLLRVLDGQATAVLRSALRYLEQQDGPVVVSSLKELFDADYSGLGQHDYEQCLALCHRKISGYSDDRVALTAFTLKVGVLAGVSNAELIDMLNDERHFWTSEDRLSYGMRSVYQELDFAPGLTWMKAEDDRRAAAEREIIEQKLQDNQKVVNFVQNTGKLAVCVGLHAICGDDDDYIIRSIDGSEIGVLSASEERVMLIKGVSHDYLVNVERVRRLKTDVLHLDVCEEDAGFIIGKKGKRLAIVTQHLNNLGCNLCTIRVHKH